MTNDEAAVLLSELSLRLDGRQLGQANERVMNTRIATRADVNRLFDLVDHYHARAEKAEGESARLRECYTLHPSHMSEPSRRALDHAIALMPRTMDIHARKDSVEYMFQVDVLKYVKPPAGYEMPELNYAVYREQPVQGEKP